MNNLTSIKEKFFIRNIVIHHNGDTSVGIFGSSWEIKAENGYEYDFSNQEDVKYFTEMITELSNWYSLYVEPEFVLYLHISLFKSTMPKEDPFGEITYCKYPKTKMDGEKECFEYYENENTFP